MTPTEQWEAAEIVASLNTYIGGIEDVLKQPMVQAVAYLIAQVDDVYATLTPIYLEAIDHATVNLPWEDDDDAS